jgi:predicted TIM-barrel fold metal-dependent hydrolase
MKTQPFPVIDAHTHFFSFTWLSHFVELTGDRFRSDDGVERIAEMLDWEAPPVNPCSLGEKWLAEQKKYGIDKQVLFASKLDDGDYLAAATRAFPDRLIGYVTIDPTREHARNEVQYAVNILDMRGILLFPGLHHFCPADEQIYPIYEEALIAEVPVFIHFGMLDIPIYRKLGLSANIDVQYSDPGALSEPLKTFENLNFIVPHFGSGRFDELLQIAARHDNIFVDSSSSNSWLQEKKPLTLLEVFERTIDVMGPQRILFGTDSSYFPRGWREDIFDTQLEILNRLNVSESDMALIFGGNIKRLLHLD